jgi:4a-hydroxytetrahydrobiopterin dehydratase
MELHEQHCVPCEGGVPPLNPDTVKGMLGRLPHPWQTDNSKIWSEFTFKDFKEAMVFVNKVAEIAESEGHHPDIYVFYNKVKLELSTHAIGGLSENDFILAAKIDKAAPVS